MNPQPFDVRKKRQPAPPGSVIRQYRPLTDLSLPQTVQDAFRQIPEQVYNNRQQFGPATITAKGSGNPITVLTTPAGAGVTLKLTRLGNWVISAAVALKITGDNGQLFTLSLSVGGGRQGWVATWKSPGDAEVMMHQSWMFTSQQGDETCVLLIEKDGGGGTSEVNPGNTTLTATWQGSQ